MPERPEFIAGRNIAMKAPPHAYEETLRFYREVLGFHEVAEHRPSVVYEFGASNPWIDRVLCLSQAKTWLFEVYASDLAAAEKLLAAEKIVRCDEIKPLSRDSRHSGYPVPHRSFISSAKRRSDRLSAPGDATRATPLLLRGLIWILNGIELPSRLMLRGISRRERSAREPKGEES